MKIQLPKRDAQFFAELAIDNGECGAQLEISDPVLRESLILNVKTVIEQALKEQEQRR